MKHSNLISLVILIIFLPAQLKSGFERINLHPRINGKGLSGIASKRYYSAELNPASLIKRNINFSFIHTPSEFGLEELSSNSFLANFTIWDQPFTTSIRKFGSNLYEETNYNISSSKLIEKEFAIGASLNFNQLSINNYGKITEASVDLGINFQLLENISVGVVGWNINQRMLNKLENEIPFVGGWGIAYQFSKDGEICVDAIKDINAPLEIIIGGEYMIHENLILLAGLNSMRSLYSCGFVINWSGLEFSFSINQHTILGATKSFGITFNFAK